MRFIVLFLGILLYPALGWTEEGTGGALATSFLDYTLKTLQPAQDWMWILIILGFGACYANPKVRENKFVGWIALISLIRFLWAWSGGIGFSALVVYGAYRLAKFILTKIPILGSAINWLGANTWAKLKEGWGYVSGAFGLILIFGFAGSKWLTTYEYGGFPVGMLPLFGAFAYGVVMSFGWIKNRNAFGSLTADFAKKRQIKELMVRFQAATKAEDKPLALQIQKDLLALDPKNLDVKYALLKHNPTKKENNTIDAEGQGLDENGEPLALPESEDGGESDPPPEPTTQELPSSYTPEAAWEAFKQII